MVLKKNKNININENIYKESFDTIEKFDIIDKLNNTIENKNPEDNIDINDTELECNSEIHKNIDLKSNDFLKELLLNQLKNINSNKKLNYGDMKRISKFLTNSIFHETACSLWNGYVTNEKNHTKGTYINFYFNKKKLHYIDYYL